MLLLIVVLALLAVFTFGIGVGITWATCQFKRATEHPIGGRR